MGGPRVGGVRPTAQSQPPRIAGSGVAGAGAGAGQQTGSDTELFGTASPLVFADSDDNR